jgi:hypothetical protein
MGRKQTQIDVHGALAQLQDLNENDLDGGKEMNHEISDSSDSEPQPEPTPPRPKCKRRQEQCSLSKLVTMLRADYQHQMSSLRE